jgi:trehalose 6-phosphate synthase/phosphatase
MYMKQRIIIASNRLPISIKEVNGTLTLERSNGGLATGLSSVMNQYDAKWFGWPGTTNKIRRWQLKVLGADYRLKAINISEDLVGSYYDRLSNGILWPLLHGFDAATSYTADDWEAYRQVNLRFAKAMQKSCKPDDMIWVHDYHLLLVPQMLRELGVENRIGFFLHTPFARADCLDELAENREVIASLAQVDVLGFQTKRDVQSFLGAAETKQVPLRKGQQVADFPIGVDYDAYHASFGSKGMRREMTKIIPTATDKQVILSVSRLDYTKGILEQLQAYEQLLANPVTTQRLLYKLIVAPSREDAAGYRELRQSIEQTVARINRTYGTAAYQPIDFTYRNCGFDEVSAWYALADTLLVTPRIDGMNLVVKEYIAARQDNQGALVLSNTIGAAQQLHQAILVEAQNVNAIAGGLVAALTMSPEARSQRFAALRHNVQAENIYWWLDTFLTALGQQSNKQTAASRVHEARLRISNRLRSRPLMSGSTVSLP